MRDLKSIIVLLRPNHYVKNLFVFLPLFFGGKITDLNLFFSTFLAFVAFSISASAVYIFNDYIDIESDRKHELKKLRPLASGALKSSKALAIMVLLLVVGNVLMFYVNIYAATILWVYIALNAAYSILLKHISILDVTIIALGFVLRLFVGSFVTSIHLSIWIITMTFLLALFIALAKRRDDVLLFNETGNKMRKVVDGYNLLYLDSAMILMASVVIVAYILYTTSAEVMSRYHGGYFYYTTLFVILGILRFLQNTFVDKKSGSPTYFVFKDLFMIITIFAWFITYIVILYL